MSIIGEIMEPREDIAKLMSKCVKCGDCRKVCPAYGISDCDPVTVMKNNPSASVGCIGCGKCTDICSNTDPMRVMMYTMCIERGAQIPEIFKETGYHLPRSEMDVPSPIYEGTDSYLMPGCFVNGLMPFIENAAVDALDVIGIKTGKFEGGCCTFPIPYRIMTDEERNARKRKLAENLESRIITLCAGCENEMIEAGVDATHIMNVFYDNIEKIREKCDIRLKVAIQPGCHVTDDAYKFKEIVEATGAEVLDKPHGCCGKAVKGVADTIMEQRQKEMSGADVIVVGCPACFSRYDNYDNGIPVLHLSELISISAKRIDTRKYHKIK